MKLCLRFFDMYHLYMLALDAVVSMLDVRQSVNVGLTEAGSYRASMQ